MGRETVAARSFSHHDAWWITPSGVLEKVRDHEESILQIATSFNVRLTAGERRSLQKWVSRAKGTLRSEISGTDYQILDLVLDRFFGVGFIRVSMNDPETVGLQSENHDNFTYIKIKNAILDNMGSFPSVNQVVWEKGAGSDPFRDSTDVSSSLEEFLSAGSLAELARSDSFSTFYGGDPSSWSDWQAKGASVMDRRILVVGLARYGLPEGVSNPGLWVEASRRVHERVGHPLPELSALTYVRLGGQMAMTPPSQEDEAQADPGFFARMKSSLKGFGRRILPYIASMATMTSSELTEMLRHTLKNEPIPPETKEKFVNKIINLGTANAITVLTDMATSEAGPPSRRYQPRRASVVEADVAVDDLEAYYTGEDLPFYCSSCRHGDFTDTGKVGCTISDDPEVREFLIRFQKPDELLITKDEKCPKLSYINPIQTQDTILGFLVEESTASIVKEVPMEAVPDESERPTDSELHEYRRLSQESNLINILEEAVEDFLENPDSEGAQEVLDIIRGSIKAISKEDSRAQEAMYKDYSHPDQQ